MVEYIKSKLLVLASLVLLGAPALAPVAIVNAANPPAAPPDINQGLCQGVNLDVQNKTSCDQAVDKNTVQQKLNTIINWISVIVGVIAVIMIIFAGFRYITSGGSQEKIKGAKDTLLYAIIGLVIVALAQIIVKFVINQSGSSVNS